MWHHIKNNKMLNSKTLGNKIVNARKKLNLTQSELSYLVRISPQAVGKWERGESIPDITTLNRLAEIFKVDLNYFSKNERINQIEDPTVALTENEEWSWKMSEGNWSDCNFSGLKNLKEKLSSSNIKNCKFINSDLSLLTLGKNNIEISDFSSSDISNSKIQTSNLLKTDFSKSLFINTKFYKSNIEKCNFSNSNFNCSEFIETNLEQNNLIEAIWKSTRFLKSNLSKVIFSGKIENCYFEHCAFYGVKFENAEIKNTFFKYNTRFKKVQFINCKVDSITYAFLKNNKANLVDVQIIE